MFKKIPWKTILLTLLAWILFWEVKETITGERGLFLYRWIYSEMSYAKNIEILTYLLTDDQVCYMLSHPNEEITQPNQKDLDLINVNVVLRLRNLNGGIAYGKLSWTMPGWGWSSVDVNDIPISSNLKKKYGDIIISLGIRIASSKDIPLIQSP